MARRRLARSLGHRADQTGLLLAGGNLPLTFQRTLMPRPTMDQALVSGLSLATNHAFVALVQETIQSVALLALGRRGQDQDDEEAWSRATIVADLLAAGLGLALQRTLEQRPGEHLPRAAARTGGFFLTATGVAAAIVGGLQEVAAGRSKRRRWLPPVIPAASAMAVAAEVMRRRRAKLDADLPPSTTAVNPLRALGIGAGVSLALSAMGLAERAAADGIARAAARVVPVDEALLRPLGHAATLAAVVYATRALVEQAFGRIESKETSVEAAFDIPPPNPLVSGSYDSLVRFDTLSRQGGRYVWTVTPPRKIAELMDTDDVQAPIRVYVGLGSADTEEGRVALVLDELERTGAFERSWILVDSPTGTGYVNYAAVNALEVLARGDCATIAMQYAARPSVLSLDRVKEGRRQSRLLLEALHARLERIPADHRPRLVLFGESLGAWSSQDPFVDRGTAGLDATGVDRAIWIGTPHFSKWKEQVLRDDRPDVDAAALGVFNDIDEWHALGPDACESIRYVMITHHNDGVALFGPELAFQAPAWLGPAEGRPSGVPKGMRWVPTATFFQVLVDMKNSATVVPGQFAATGHDYRADLLPFFDAVLGFGATEAQRDRIAAWLEENELQRTNWIKQHGATGKSLAVAVLEEAMRELREEGVDANQRLVHLMAAAAERGLAAEGGAHIEATPPSGDSTG
jgi:uncharacterized membrane protein